MFIYGWEENTSTTKNWGFILKKKSVDFSSMFEFFTNTYFYGNTTYLLEN